MSDSMKLLWGFVYLHVAITVFAGLIGNAQLVSYGAISVGISGTLVVIALATKWAMENL